MGSQIVESLQSSTTRVLERIAILLPGLFALLLAVVVFTLIGWALSWILRQALMLIHFDDRFGRGSSQLAEWSPTQTPTILVTRIVFWALVVLGFAVGFEAFGASSDSVIAVDLIGYLPRIVGAAVILFTGTIIARFLSRSVLIGAVNMNLHYARLLSLGVKWLVLVLTGAMVLEHLHIGEAIVELAFGILFGGIVLALSLSVGLGSRDLVSRSLERESARPGPVQGGNDAGGAAAAFLGERRRTKLPWADCRAGDLHRFNPGDSGSGFLPGGSIASCSELGCGPPVQHFSLRVH